MYKVIWKERVQDDFDNISPIIAFQIKKKVETYLAQAPLKLGKALTGEYKGLYRYRFGDYRVIYKVVMDELIVIVVKIGHRSDVY